MAAGSSSDDEEADEEETQVGEDFFSSPVFSFRLRFFFLAQVIAFIRMLGSNQGMLVGGAKEADAAAGGFETEACEAPSVGKELPSPPPE